MTIAFVLFLVVVGTLVFHFWSPWWLTPLASNILRAETAAIAATTIVNFELNSS